MLTIKLILTAILCMFSLSGATAEPQPSIHHRGQPSELTQHQQEALRQLLVSEYNTMVATTKASGMQLAILCALPGCIFSALAILSNHIASKACCDQIFCSIVSRVPAGTFGVYALVWMYKAYTIHQMAAAMQPLQRRQD